MIGCVPKLNGLSNLAPTGKMTVSSTFRHNPFFYFSAIVLFCVRKHAFTHTSHGVIHTNVKSGTFKKTRTFFKKNKSFFKNSMAFLEKT